MQQTAIPETIFANENQSIQAIQPNRNWLEVIQDYIELTKPRIIVLLLITTAGAMWIASEGEVDLSHLIHSPAAGVFAALQDEALFAAVLVDHGAVAWPQGLDLAPDAMHRAIRATGCFRPGTERAA